MLEAGCIETEDNLSAGILIQSNTFIAFWKVAHLNMRSPPKS